MSRTARDRRERLAQVEELFAASKAVPKEARAAFLADRCGSDAELRQEVAALLDLEDKSGSFLEEPADPWIGRRIDRWRVVERIGAGGMGVVYLAERDDGVYRQKVALKLLKQGVERRELLERFRRERQVLAALSHPHVARLIDGGATPEGVPYFVMEHVDGTRLDVWCDERKLSIEQRLALFTDVCAAVHYAHQNLVIHRDLKPSNVLVTADGVAKLVDFGISKVLEPLPTDEVVDPPAQDATRTIERRLTPEYSSPEVVRGRSVSTASDVFSLGVVLYELLTGRRPWQLAEQSPTDLERAICESTPARPSGASISPAAAAARGVDEKALRQALRGDLDAIVMTALAPEPERRYASVEGLAADLERHRRHEPIVARPPGVGYLASKFVRRHRALVAAAIVALLALAGGIAGLVSGNLKARRQAASTERVNKLLREILVQLDPGSARGFAQSLENQLHYARDQLDQGLLREDPAIEVDLRATLARIYGGLGFPGWASREAAIALELGQRVWGDGDARLVPLFSWLGWAERNCANFAESAEHLRAAADIAARTPGLEADRARALHELGLTLTELRRYEDADAALREAMALRLALGDDAEAMAGIQTAVALNSLARNDVADAERMARAALAAREKLYPQAHPRLPYSLDTLGRVLLAKREFAESQALFERGLTMRRELFDPKSPVIAWSLERIAEVQTASGRPAEAVPRLEECLEIRRLRYDPHERVVLQTAALLGLALAAAGESTRAIPLLEEATARREEEGFSDAPWMSQAVAELERCRVAIAR